MPVDVLIMAGGEGKRLRPLTQNTPKPLLKVNNKPIIKRVIDHISSFGVKKYFVSTGYLGDQISTYLNTFSNFKFDF